MLNAFNSEHFEQNSPRNRHRRSEHPDYPNNHEFDSSSPLKRITTQIAEFESPVRIKIPKKSYEQKKGIKENPGEIQLTYEHTLTNNFLINNWIFNCCKKRIYKVMGIPSTDTKFDLLNYYSKWWKFYDNLVNLLNFIVIILIIHNYDLNYEYPRRLDNDIQTSKVIIFTLTVISIFCIIRRHMVKQQFKDIEVNDKANVEEENTEDFLFEESNFTENSKNSPLIKNKLGMIIDILIIIILPYPYLDFIFPLYELDRENNIYIKVEYKFSDILSLLVLLRIIHLVRAGINYSMFSNLYTQSIAKEFNIRINIRYVLKCILKTQHINIVIVFLIFSVAIFGYALRICERPFFSAKGRLDFEPYFNSFYCVFITMTTIGYGDFYPNTRLGKVIMCCAGLWGTFICSLVIVCLYGLLDLSQDQFLVFVKVIKSKVAAKFIESAWKFRLAMKKEKREKNSEVSNLTKNERHTKRSFKSFSQEVKDEYKDLTNICNEFRGMRKESKSIYRSNGPLYYHMKLMLEVQKLNRRLDYIEDDVELGRRGRGEGRYDSSKDVNKEK